MRQILEFRHDGNIYILFSEDNLFWVSFNGIKMDWYFRKIDGLCGFCSFIYSYIDYSNLYGEDDCSGFSLNKNIIVIGYTILTGKRYIINDDIEYPESIKEQKKRIKEMLSLFAFKEVLKDERL